jgi:hypothetical protein
MPAVHRRAEVGAHVNAVAPEVERKTGYGAAEGMWTWQAAPRTAIKKLSTFLRSEHAALTSGQTGHHSWTVPSGPEGNEFWAVRRRKHSSVKRTSAGTGELRQRHESARCGHLDAAKRSTRMPGDVSRGARTKRAGTGSGDGRHSRLISP